jgi:hypothetical protein
MCAWDRLFPARSPKTQCLTSGAPPPPPPDAEGRERRHIDDLHIRRAERHDLDRLVEADDQYYGDMIPII